MNYVKVQVKNAEQIVALLDDFGRRQVPFAMALAATRIAKRAERELYDEMRQVFDRPTKWTLNSLYVRKATKRTMEALVKLKDDAYKGIAPTKYLAPQIFGGARRWKRHERALQQVGILPAGMYCVPGPAAQMDAFGNMSKSQIIQILSHLRAFGEQGYKANATDRGIRSRWKGSVKKGVRGFEYFALPSGHGKLPPGIYLRKNYSEAEGSKVAHLSYGGARAVLFFIKSPTYSKRLDFFGVVERVIAQHAESEFIQALEYAKSTALAHQSSTFPM